MGFSTGQDCRVIGVSHGVSLDAWARFVVEGV